MQARLHRLNRKTVVHRCAGDYRNPIEIGISNHLVEVGVDVGSRSRGFTNFACNDRRYIVMHVAHCRHCHRIEILSKFDVAVGMPATHATTANQCNLEGHID